MAIDSKDALTAKLQDAAKRMRAVQEAVPRAVAAVLPQETAPTIVPGPTGQAPQIPASAPGPTSRPR